MRVATQGGIGFVGQWVCDDGFARSDPHLCAITEGDLISLPCVGSGELAMLFYLIAAPLFLLGVIPIALNIDLCPSAGPDRADAIGIVDQELPCLPACLDNGLVAVPDQGAELVGA